MQNLIFSLNATMPIFLTMMTGYLLHQLGLMDDVFTAKCNKFVFQVALPAMVFEDLAVVDFHEVWDPKFVIFCFTATLISILAVTGISCLWKDKTIQGEFIQASYRSSAAILGIAFIKNIYGNSGMAPLMIIGTVPLYNIMAVIVLSVMKPQRQPLDRKLMKKTLIGILTNPILIGILAGLLWSVLRIPMPQILGKTISNVGSTSSPLGLMAMGACFEWKQMGEKGKQALTAAFIKLVGLAGIFLPVAIWLGFREEKLIAILVMLGSATTVSCYVMAKNMDHEGTLTSSVVMLTTLLSAFTLTTWLYLLRTFGLI